MALNRVLAVLRRRLPWSVLDARFETARGELRSAAERDAAALVGEDQLRELAALVGSPDRHFASAALMTALALFGAESPARGVQLARADGLAAAVVAHLRGSNDAAAMASDLLSRMTGTPEAAHKLLARVPVFVAAAGEVFALSVPSAAARLAGVDVDAVAAAAGRRPALVIPAGVLHALLHAMTNVVRAAERGAPRQSALAAAMPPCYLPALVALAAHGDPELSAGAAKHLCQIAANAALVPRAFLCFFDCAAPGGHGLRGVEAALQKATARLRTKALRNARTHAAAVTALILFVCVTLQMMLRKSPKRLGGAAAAAWVVAAPQLEAIAAQAVGSVKILPPSAIDSQERAQADSNLAILKAGLALLVKWAARAQQVAASATQGGADAMSSSSGQGGAPVQQRCCAACGRARADGARLHRCRGCGALTGVMYCGDACARAHWVRGGHRKVCEPASAELKELRQVMGALSAAP